MFYDWFLWQFDATDIDIDPPIKEWKCTQRTKETFIDAFVYDIGIKDKSTIAEIHNAAAKSWEEVSHADSKPR